jgi:hypothetical protein
MVGWIAFGALALLAAPTPAGIPPSTIPTAAAADFPVSSRSPLGVPASLSYEAMAKMLELLVS